MSRPVCRLTHRALFDFDTAAVISKIIIKIII